MILVTGGAGYIGSHFVHELVKEQEVLVIDDLSTGHRRLIDEKAIFVQGSLLDEDFLKRVFEAYPIEAVVHFAGSSLVGESVIHPIKYYENNVSATFLLLKTMVKYNVKNIIFSSSAATYGIPVEVPVTEEHNQQPINPYGKSKLIIEGMLKDFAKSYDLNYIALRYFNASGAHTSGRFGEIHDPETHLIPIILEHLLGKRDSISVFGNNYDTHDGTCIRDYVHVTDLAKAHILSLNALLQQHINKEIFNLGNGTGYSVLEVIRACEMVAGRKAKVIVEKRRSGDPAILVASSEKIRHKLGWVPVYDLTEIVETAWHWHDSQYKGIKIQTSNI